MKKLIKKTFILSKQIIKIYFNNNSNSKQETKI
jgi:hypothetical protein